VSAPVRRAVLRVRRVAGAPSDAESMETGRTRRETRAPRMTTRERLAPCSGANDRCCSNSAQIRFQAALRAQCDEGNRIDPLCARRRYAITSRRVMDPGRRGDPGSTASGVRFVPRHEVRARYRAWLAEGGASVLDDPFVFALPASNPNPGIIPALFNHRQPSEGATRAAACLAARTLSESKTDQKPVQRPCGATSGCHPDQSL